MAEEKRFGFYYGNVIVAAGFLASFLCWGAYRCYGLFVQPMTAEFGWTRGAMSLAYSAAFLLSGLLSVASGRVVDRFGPKIVLVTSGLFLGVGYILMSQVSSLWQLFLFYSVIIGAGMSGTDNPMLATIARWFTTNRGVVTGIVKAGAGLGIFVLPPLAGWIITNYGWPAAFLVIGVIVLVGMELTGFSLKWGQKKESAAPVKVNSIASNGGSNPGHLTLRQAMRTRSFWIFSIVWFILVLVTQTIMLHIAPHAIDVGISPVIAATVVSVLGGASILGRVGMGFLSDRMGTKTILLTSQTVLMASFIWLFFAREPWMFYLFVVTYGVAHGAFYTLISPILAELFGLRALGAIMGTVIFAGTIGGSIGPAMAGSIFDITRSYQLDFSINLGLTALSIILVLFLKPVSKAKVEPPVAG